jgi:hypothetical protein
MCMRLASAGLSLLVAAIAANVPVAARAQGPTSPVAASPWSTPVAVTSTLGGTLSFGPTLAFGASGLGLATWSYELGTGHTGQRAAQRRLDGSFGPEVELPVPIEAPLVYGQDDAVALVRTSRSARRVRVVFGSTSGQFGAEQTIYTSPPARAAFARITANDRGDIAVVQRVLQRDGSGRIVLVERRPGGSFGRPRVVRELHACAPPTCYTSPDAGYDVAVAVGPRGDLVVAWQEGADVLARVRRAGRMGRAVRIGAYGRIWGGLRTAVSTGGAAWVAWFDSYVASGKGPMWIRIATRPAGAGRFARRRTLDHLRSLSFTNFQTVYLALDPQGMAFVAWRGPQPKLATLDARGHPLRTRPLGAGDDVLGLATSGRPGEAVVLWARQPDYLTGEMQIFGALTTAGAFSSGAVTPLAPVGGPIAAFAPAAGPPTVLWAQTPPALTTSSKRQVSTIFATTRLGG